MPGGVVDSRTAGSAPVRRAAVTKARASATSTSSSRRLRTRGAEDAIAADIVVVSTPPGCHAADAIRLLEAGAAVLLEKPLCRTLEEADRIVAAARAHGNRLLYGENLAYSPSSSISSRTLASSAR
jgi:predicted dehydrogenase